MKQLLLFIFSIGFFANKAQLTIDAESGVAAFGYNDVRISGKDGSLFSLSNEFTNDVKPFFRARLQYDLGKRHSILALYAPLKIQGSGISDQNIYFAGEVFEKGTRVSSSWKFNSYRLSYQYKVIMKEKFILALGLTAKIRDAEISLSNSETQSKKTNLGVVPLVRFYMDWNFKSKAHLIVDGDALVGTQGRAEDVFVGFGYNFIERLRIKAGYRLLEGGADNDEVYNFSLVHYGVIAAAFTF